MTTTKHVGPVQLQISADRVTVLCPAGHLVASQAIGPDFAHSRLAARIGEHRAHRNWVVECGGTL